MKLLLGKILVRASEAGAKLVSDFFLKNARVKLKPVTEGDDQYSDKTCVICMCELDDGGEVHM